MNRSWVWEKRIMIILSRGNRRAYAKKKKGESTWVCWGVFVF